MAISIGDTIDIYWADTGRHGLGTVEKRQRSMHRADRLAGSIPCYKRAPANAVDSSCIRDDQNRPAARYHDFARRKPAWLGFR